VPRFYRHPLDIVTITGGFGDWYTDQNGNPYQHRGIDYGAGTGTTVYAPAPGRVSPHTNDGGFGISVCLRHDDGTYTLYAHLSVALVALGAWVTTYDQIGLTGNTGTSTGPHLHWQWCRTSSFPRDITQSMDPLPYIQPWGPADEPQEEPMTPQERAEFDALRARLDAMEMELTAPMGLRNGVAQAYALNRVLTTWRPILQAANPGIILP
jgi:hypothetical protein